MGIWDFFFGDTLNGNKDGSSAENAILVKSVHAEREWLRRNCPSFNVEVQALQLLNKRPYDVIQLVNSKGEQRTVYFDISSFYGKFQS